MRRTLVAPSPVAAQAAPSLSVKGAIDLFLDACKAKGLSPGTVQGFYHKRLDFFLRWLGRDMTPDAVTPTLLRDFLIHERERTSPATAKHAYRSLSVLFNFCEREGIVRTNPMRSVDPPRVPTKLVEPLTEEQVTRLLAACGEGFVGLRLRALLLVFVDCGLRLSELCGLTLQDVDLEGQTLKVMGKGAKERAIPFGEATKMALEQYLAKRGDLATDAFFVGCFGDPLQARQVHKAITDCGKRAGLSGVHPHRLRHTAAVMYLRGGGDAFSLQKLLGHSSLEMTRRYCALADSDLRDAHRRASPGDKFLAQVQPRQGRRRLR